MAARHDIWQRNHDLLHNAGSLVATSGLTSVFGVVFWIVAARGFSQQAVGYGAAAVSAMTLLGTIGMFGLGTMLIGEFPRHRDQAGLFTAALLASGFGSLVLGLGFALIVLAFGGHFPEISGTPARLVLFAVGVGLLLAWVVGTLLSVVPAAIMLGRGGARIFHRPDWARLRRLGKVALAHNWLNLAIATPPKLIPVLGRSSCLRRRTPRSTSPWMMASLLFMVPNSDLSLSGRLRSETATASRYAIRGYISTAAKHGESIITAIRDALAGNPGCHPSPRNLARKQSHSASSSNAGALA
jgi:hypothetical protein